MTATRAGTGSPGDPTHQDFLELHQNKVRSGYGGTVDLYDVVRITSDPDKERAEFAVIVRDDVAGRGLACRGMMARFGISQVIPGRTELSVGTGIQRRAVQLIPQLDGRLTSSVMAAPEDRQERTAPADDFVSALRTCAFYRRGIRPMRLPLLLLHRSEVGEEIVGLLGREDKLRHSDRAVAGYNTFGQRLG
jgi:hypothetical protein